jgi:hypothetical protein
MIQILLLLFLPRSTHSQFIVVTTGTCAASGYSQLLEFHMCVQGVGEVFYAGELIPKTVNDANFYPPGCVYSNYLQLNMGVDNNNFACNNVYQCICYQGTVCPNTGGVTINSASCLCGRRACTAKTGLYCFASHSLCSKSSAFIKIKSNSCSDYSARPIGHTNDCDFAASALSLTDTSSVALDAVTAVVLSGNNLPSGCYLDLTGGGTGELTLNRYASMGSSSRCSPTNVCVCAVVAGCTYTDGSQINTVPCACGAMGCTTTTGLFCDTSIAKGGATGQCSLAQAGPWYIHRELGRCNDVGIGGTYVRTAVDCRNAALQYGFTNTNPLASYSTNRTSGCSFDSVLNELYFNTNVDSTVDCRSSNDGGACLCSIGHPVCDHLYGTSASSGTSCRCGSSLCTASTGKNDVILSLLVLAFLQCTMFSFFNFSCCFLILLGMYCYIKSNSCITVAADVVTVQAFNLFRTGLGSPDL